MGEKGEKGDISLSSPYQVPVGLWKQGKVEVEVEVKVKVKV